MGKKITSDSWHFKKENSQAHLAELQKELNEYQHWDKLLTNRSQGWVCMELLSEFVPQDGSIILTGVQYSMAHSSDKKFQQGLVKTWVISGLTNIKMYQKLDEDYNTLDPKKMKTLFRKIAKVTEDSSYSPDVAGRDLRVNFSRQGAARGRVKTGGPLSITFSLIITQSYSGTDPVSLAGIQ